MNRDKNIYNIISDIRKTCDAYISYVDSANVCAYTDRKVEQIIEYSVNLSKEYSNMFKFERNRFKYTILDYWTDEDDLYVHYEVEDKENDLTANVIDYYNISDLDCNYNDFNDEEIKNSLYRLLEQHNGYEFNLARVSSLSPLLQFIYDRVCESESNMCHIDYNDWEEIKEEYDFLEEDFITLKKETTDHNLEDYITFDDNEYKICAYGCLQCQFDDDREKGSDGLER